MDEAAMNIGYSLLIDEYVDVNQMEKSDCELLQICCPACLKRVELTQSGGRVTLSHAASFARADTPCENHIPDSTPEYRAEHNDRAREERVKFLQWVLFKELLNQDPVAHYETHAMMVLSNLKSQGALLWLPEWHLEMVRDVHRRKLEDKVEFWSAGAKHLAGRPQRFQHVPCSGYGREVQFQIAYDLMQHILSRKGIADDNYSWLFTHAFLLCMQRWTGGADLGPESGEEYPKNADADLRERIAAPVSWSVAAAICCQATNKKTKKASKS